MRLFSSVVIIPNFLISTQSYFQAFQLCKDIDEKDTVYLALAIEFDVELVSKDEELIEGLRRKGYTKVLTLTEFFQRVDESESP